MSFNTGKEIVDRTLDVLNAYFFSRFKLFFYIGKSIILFFFFKGEASVGVDLVDIISVSVEVEIQCGIWLVAAAENEIL